ncbi:hypothetical protein PIB30_013773 [Stylosanthes scabra]|uniref:Uncharacterized protein n=1 Tax=Stylosanthes scabra TaxID=79078 RepID=A0ABU6Q6F8_9FABA|nr:hypothetical protein [Stylosanthes scabra]
MWSTTTQFSCTLSDLFYIERSAAAWSHPNASHTEIRGTRSAPPTYLSSNMNGFGDRSWRDIVTRIGRVNNNANDDVNDGQSQRTRETGKQGSLNDGIEDKWLEIERRTHSIFVDNLPSHISKRFLYNKQKTMVGMIPTESKEPTKTRREVEVKVAENQKELLNRSILAESVEPIRFGSVVKRLDELQMQYGKIECRDLGPRKCILLLDTIELRDKAL